mmetsp:Transcript_56699/g.77292  ORF Transcript_56699/g.77292 Transcript_56699/m.77292 type:complete len:240 (-) Transcript_56699:848-1567(-)
MHLGHLVPSSCCVWLRGHLYSLRRRLSSLRRRLLLSRTGYRHGGIRRRTLALVTTAPSATAPSAVLALALRKRPILRLGKNNLTACVASITMRHTWNKLFLRHPISDRLVVIERPRHPDFLPIHVEPLLRCACHVPYVLVIDIDRTTEALQYLVGTLVGTASAVVTNSLAFAVGSFAMQERHLEWRRNLRTLLRTLPTILRKPHERVKSFLRVFDVIDCLQDVTINIRNFTASLRSVSV